MAISSKAKDICTMYRDGIPISVISAKYGHNHSVIYGYIKRFYTRIFNVTPMFPTEKKLRRAAELFAKYGAMYVPFKYSRKDLCEQFGCTASELEYMFHKYNITHDRLQTYRGQKTLCNVPNECFEEYKEASKKFGFKSVRAFAQVALADWIVSHMED